MTMCVAQFLGFLYSVYFDFLKCLSIKNFCCDMAQLCYN